MHCTQTPEPPQTGVRGWPAQAWEPVHGPQVPASPSHCGAEAGQSVSERQATQVEAEVSQVGVEPRQAS